MVWSREHQDFVLCFDTSHKVIASISEPVNGHLLQVIIFISNYFNTVVEKACNLLHIGWHLGGGWCRWQHDAPLSAEHSWLGLSMYDSAPPSNNDDDLIIHDPLSHSPANPDIIVGRWMPDRHKYLMTASYVEDHWRGYSNFKQFVELVFM